jgi:hypothetical protein
MYDDIDNERDFWHDEPTRKLGRLPQRALTQRPASQRTGAQRPATGQTWQRSRQHIPVITTPAGPQRRPLDPFLKRLGLMLCLGLVMVPVALSLRHGASDMLRTAPTGGAAAVPVGGAVSSTVTSLVGGAEAAVVVVDTAAVAALEIAPTATTVFDIDALEPAVPVNPDPETVADTAPATTQAVAVQKASQPPVTAVVAATPATTAKSEQKVEVSVAPTCAKSYEVVAGDYWINIADKVGSSLKDVLAANNATVNTPLFPGRDICLPKSASAPTVVTTPATNAPTKTPTNTAKPATTAAPTTTLPRRTYTAAEVEQIIRDVWPDDLEDEAIRIARRESNLQPTAHNACCYGLFQIYFTVHRGWLAPLGITSAEQLFDPRNAATAGYALYQRSGGWAPWAV